MPSSYFPLRWESTGDQWWYACPIDWAAANGHYDLVRELLHIDPNLLIKLTSLRRIRRLETVWDDDARFADVARCRSLVARSLLLECETKDGNNALIRAGYGGWLLYTAASAGDMGFIQELLQRAPLMVFGEGEFGVTDILYAAARSKNSGIFRLLLDFALNPRCLAGIYVERHNGENATVFRWEILNRAVHAAARGGDLSILQDLLVDCRDVLAYRDAQGSTILHAASGRGQAQVVKNLVATYDIIDSRDNQGNTSLHVAAFSGHVAVVEALVVASPSSISLRNKMGDTFLHIAVAGFRTPGFRRLDRQMELMKQLISGNFVNIERIINFRNNDGRTVLHVAVVGNVQCNLVSLLMTVRSINLNVRDVNGMTPLDLISQRPRSASSEILIKQLISAGGMSNSSDYMRRSSIASHHLKVQGIGSSPGTTFKISDAEIFLYTGVVASDACEDKGSERPSSCSSVSKSDLTPLETTEVTNTSSEKKKHNSVSNAAKRLKSLLHWPRKKDKKVSGSSKLSGDEDSIESIKKCSQGDSTPTSLRQRFSKPTSLPNNKRALAVRSSMPSPSTKKRFAAGLMHGVIQAMPHLAMPHKSPPSSSSMRSMASPTQKGFSPEIETVEPTLRGTSVTDGSMGSSASQKPGQANAKVINHYFCFGAQGLAVEDAVTAEQGTKRFFKRMVPSVA